MATSQHNHPTDAQLAATLPPESDRVTVPPGVPPTRGEGSDQVAWDEVPAGLRDHPRYRLVRLLGRGGMGNVYQAEHRLMRRYVAIKVISPELFQNVAAVERFQREVQAAAKLADASDILSRNPMSLQLRYLQTLIEISSEKNSTVIFPIPIDFIKAFMEKLK